MAQPKATCPIRYNKETGKEYICNASCAFAKAEEIHGLKILYCRICDIFDFCDHANINIEAKVSIDDRDNVMKIGLYHNDSVEVCGTIGVVNYKEEE